MVMTSTFIVILIFNLLILSYFCILAISYLMEWCKKRNRFDVFGIISALLMVSVPILGLILTNEIAKSFVTCNSYHAFEEKVDNRGITYTKIHLKEICIEDVPHIWHNVSTDTTTEIYNPSQEISDSSIKMNLNALQTIGEGW